ncbi:hypothetical protein GYB62_03335 [bacterium]|nr:hypothetical protein [bacterium]
MKTESRRLELREGSKQACLIDDTYNANPEAVCAAVDVLSLFEGETVLVLGDMLELGKKAEQYHEEVGRYAKKQGVSRLITVGELAACAAQVFGAGALACVDHQQAIDELHSLASAELTVLVKGSRGSRMDIVADGFALPVSSNNTESLSC